jgi:hypothetical protein
MRPCYLLPCLLAACGGDRPPALPAWDKRLPPAGVMWAGPEVAARGIVHLHSPFSHDACDGQPRDAGGVPNEPCLQSLRRALCTTRIDFAALTDHDNSMADEPFEALFHMRDGDVAVRDGGGRQIASRMTCDDGHQVVFTVGGENDLMPIMLDEHVPGDAAQRRATYNGKAEADIAAFRAAGARVWIPHTESRTLEHLRAVQPDGLEIYNLHANIDPNIRRDHLGLDSAAAIAAAVEFADTNPGHPEPDLALLAFLSPNGPALSAWNTLLAEGQRVAATAGSDAHENALPILLADGERGDSYRRVLRWFGNVALVADPTDPVQIEDALAAGRMFAVFELLGTPEGLDVRAGAATLGASLAPGSELVVTVPHVRGLDPSLPAPAIHATVLRADAGGPTQIATGQGPELRVALPTPGAYRIEITIVPRHLGPYLGDLGPALAERELPWVYTSPIYVQ